MPSYHPWLLMVFTMIIGSLATLVPRILETTPCSTEVCPYRTNDDTNASSEQVNDNTNFHAPLYSGLMVFIASSLGIPIYSFWIRPSSSIPPSPSSLSSSASGAFSPLADSSLWLKLLLPSLLNVSGTVAQLCALLYIPAAVLAGMRGILIVGTALLSKVTKLPDAPQGKYEWFYIILSVFSTILIGIATLIPTTTSSSSDVSTVSMVYGILLCIFGYTVAAGQATLEAHTLDAGISKWIILGIEGIIGSTILLTVLGILTAFPTNPLEQPQHTLCCIQQHPSVTLPLSVSYGTSSLIFNTLLLTLSSLLGANLRVFIFTARGILTLIIETVLYYVSSSTQIYGTVATPWLALELSGFLLLIYSGLARVRIQTERSNRAKQEIDTDNDPQEALLLSHTISNTTTSTAIRTSSIDSTLTMDNVHAHQQRSSSFAFLPLIQTVPNDGMSRSSLSLNYDPKSYESVKLSLNKDPYDTTLTTTESLLIYDPHPPMNDPGRTHGKQ